MKRFIRYAVAMLVLISLPTFAQPRLGNWGWGRGVGYAGLNMTDAQVEALGELQHTFYETNQSLYTDLAAKTAAFQDLLAQQNADASEVLSAQKSVLAQQQKIQEEILKYDLKARDLLTPEQKALLPQGTSFGFGMGMGLGLGMGRGVGFGRSMGWGNGFGGGRGRGWGRGWNTGLNYGPGMGRGIRCPYWWR